jgi:hypothetical protein
MPLYLLFYRYLLRQSNEDNYDKDAIYVFFKYHNKSF